MKKNKVMIALIAFILLIVPSGVYAQDANETFTVGLLVTDTAPFIEEMSTLGYMEGENVEYLLPDYEGVDFADWDLFLERYTVEVQKMVDASVDVFIANSDLEAIGLREMVGNIPIVFVLSEDPVTTGAVADLTNPGGYTTGVVANRHHERRLQILTEINPDTDKVFHIYNGYLPEGQVVADRVQAMGDELSVEIIQAPMFDLEDSLEVLATSPDDVDWFFATSFPNAGPAFFDALGELSLDYKAPISGAFVIPVKDHMISYGPDPVAYIQQSAHLADRILRGASPEDVPVVNAENFLMVNLEAAEVLGVEIPVATLRQADLIIRPGYEYTLVLGSE